MHLNIFNEKYLLLPVVDPFVYDAEGMLVINKNNAMESLDPSIDCL
jgi:hypothetical protein